jgi:hypothetical protein
MPVGVQLYCNKKEFFLFCDYILVNNYLEEFIFLNTYQVGDLNNSIHAFCKHFSPSFICFG